MNRNLQNKDNYKKLLNITEGELFEKYMDLIEEYSKVFTKNISIKKEPYLHYVFNKGIQTISHIFQFTMLYTKNIELTFYHCQKAYFYYFEFIGQVGDNNHSFLKLNSKDAIIFCYKKTVFDLEKSEVLTNNKTSQTFFRLDELIKQYSDLISFIPTSVIKNFEEISNQMKDLKQFYKSNIINDLHNKQKNLFIEKITIFFIKNNTIPFENCIKLLNISFKENNLQHLNKIEIDLKNISSETWSNIGQLFPYLHHD